MTDRRTRARVLDFPRVSARRRRRGRRDGRRGSCRGIRTPSSIQYGFGSSYYGQAVFEDPKWDYRSLNFDTDVALRRSEGGTGFELRRIRISEASARMEANSSSITVGAIRRFRRPARLLTTSRSTRFSTSFRMGDRQLRQHAGDSIVSSWFPVWATAAAAWERTAFGNRPGAPIDPDHDVVAALEQWVEKGVAPKQLIGTGKVSGDSSATLTRPSAPIRRLHTTREAETLTRPRALRVNKGGRWRFRSRDPLRFRVLSSQAPRPDW